jgi:hypothetical protein
VTGYVQWHCAHAGTLRIGPACHAYADPYVWAATLVRQGAEVEICGVAAPSPRSVWRAVAAVLTREGLVAFWFRRGCDRRTHRYPLRTV